MGKKSKGELLKDGKKKCSKCGKIKQISDFKIRSDTGKPRGQCKKCRSEYIKEYERKNKDRISKNRKEYRDNNMEECLKKEKASRRKNKNQREEYNKRYRKEHKEEICRYMKEYRRKNVEEISRKAKEKYERNRIEICQQAREAYQENHDHIRKVKKAYRDRRIEKDILFKLRANIRGRLSYIVKLVKDNMDESSLDFIGCSVLELKKHIEKQFEPGMTWENHGEWHIDHIVPLSAFDLTKKDHVIFACHYTNLQPLWAEDNLSKGAKLDWEKTNAN